jgi:hypothetical protein
MDSQNHGAEARSTLATGSASEEIFNSEQYAKFVESMTHLCHCRSQDKPCDGVLAGGLCDNIQDDPLDDEETPSERYDREVYGDEWHTPMSL